MRQLASKVFNRKLVELVEQAKPDAVLMHNATYIFPATVHLIQQLRAKVVVFHADNPLPPHYNNFPETLPVALVADHYLVWSQLLAAKLTRLGTTDARFMPFAWDPHSFSNGRYSGREWDGALFVGNWDRQREEMLERVAKRVPLRIYGPDYWSTRTRSGSRVRKAWQGRMLNGTDSAIAFREAAVSLNLLRTQHFVDGVADGLIMRHFEVPGAGGFLLSTRSQGATTFFPEGQRGAYFDGPDDCEVKLYQHLRNPALRERIAQEASLYVAANHTYSHRMHELLALV